MLTALAVFVALGLIVRLAGPARDASDFLSAGRTLPAWAVALHFCAAEVSAMTVLGVPAAAFAEDWRYLQFFAGSAAARFFIAAALLPGLAATGAPTVYAWLESRYGPGARRWSAGAFLAARLGTTSVRFMAAAAVLAALAGGPRTGWLVLVAAGAAALAAYGGLRGVVYAGAAQGLFLIASAGAVALWTASALEGGLGELLRVAESAGKLAVWRWSPEGPFLLGAAHDQNWAPAALIGGFVGSLAAFAADQEMMQGALGARSGQGARGLMGSALASFLLLAAFLAVGTALYVFYDQHTALALPDRAESILPHFVSQNMGLRWRFLLVAMLAAAVLDLPLVGASAAAVVDLRAAPLTLKALRSAVGAAALLCVAGAVVILLLPALAPHAARLGTAGYAPVLGLLLYGVLGSRKAGRSAAPAAAAGTVLALAAMGLEAAESLPIGWHWVPLWSAGAAILAAHWYGEVA